MKLAFIIILALLGATLATGFWLLCIASRRVEDKIEDEEDERSEGDEQKN